MNEEIRKMLILLHHEAESGKFCDQDAYYLKRKLSKFFHPDMSIIDYRIVAGGLDCEEWCHATKLDENGMCTIINICWIGLEEGFERV